MTCPLCRTRKPKRACPALGASICPTCCATKRLKEIRCPSDCHYLASAQAHPAAAVQRQRERDLPLVLQLLEGLTDGQARLLSLLQQQLRAYRATAIPPLRDADVSEAARALASTFETASRGIVYEHHPSSLPAQRVMAMVQAACDELGQQDRTLRPASVAAVLRKIERAVDEVTRATRAGATDHGESEARSESEAVFLDFLERVGGGGARHARPGGGLITGTDESGSGAAASDDGPRLIIP